ncbi:MAG: ABC transporter ATP-binding protein [Pseudomonadota bacterium]
MPHVEIDALRIEFGTGTGSAAAVDGVSFALHRGATVGIVGESGSGKSTIARALLGFTRPGARVAGGTVTVGDSDVFALSPQGLREFRGRHAAMVPQNPLSSLTPHMTVGAQLTELIGLHAGLAGPSARARALELMRETDLPDPDVLYGRYPHEISGGQRQRIVIASALVARPELIVLDEPTTALDKTVEARVLDLVRRVQQTLNATLIYVSHDLNVIGAMCERVLVMRRGRVVEDGATQQIFSAPQTPYARELMRAIPQLAPANRPAKPAAGQCPVLSLQDVSFGYQPPRRLLGRRRPAPLALDGVSFNLAAGQTLGIVGESGSGKSTLASLVAGAVAGHTGRILLDDGTPLAGLAKGRSKIHQRRVQMVFQDPLSSLNPSHTVEEIVTRPLRIYFGMTISAARKTAADLMAEMDLGPEFLARRPRQLSGGQQQRIALARALAADPDILLCDEITSALDVTVQAQVLRLLQRLQDQRGLACLFITHDLAVVSEVADDLLVLEKGTVRDIGPAHDVIANPKSAYTARLLSAHRAQNAQTEPRDTTAERPLRMAQ